MDFVRDGPGLHGGDLDRVYKYEPRSATVLLIKDDRGDEWPITTHAEWVEWVLQNRPSPKKSEPGLVVLFSSHPDLSSTNKAEHTSQKSWLIGMEGNLPSSSDSIQGVDELGISMDTQNGEKEDNHPPIARHGLRTVPFSRSTFEMITRKFYTHSSISRVISRADMPVFSHIRTAIKDEDGSKYEVSVFNMRTSNAWARDLALTVTYFPHCNLKFAIVFGCDSTVEREMISRLKLAGADAAHSLLLPGIVVEIERRRHIQVVDDIVDEVEARIFDLEIGLDVEEDMTSSQREKSHRDKRSAWLNISYTRNCLFSWRKQLENLAFHADKLHNLRSSGYEWSSNSATPISASFPDKDHPLTLNENESIDIPQSVSRQSTLCHEQFSDECLTMGHKIKSRTLAIIEEYDDMIRDCSLRIEGMAMATQWAQGETNLEIAKATSRDSKHMRSIAVVTMIFLPGTFFAGFFSMIFFDWSSDTGQLAVSKYIWIYVVITVSFTLLTLGLWYYFNIYRKKGPRLSLIGV